MRQAFTASMDRVRAGGLADRGMTSAEYAVGTVAACGFAGILYKVVTSTPIVDLVIKVIEKAFSLPF